MQSNVTYSKGLDNFDADSRQKLMLFDLSINGHHPVYIRHLIDYWYQHKVSDQLDIVVSPSFMEKHSDVVDLALHCSRNTVNFLAINQADFTGLKARKTLKDRLAYNFQEWKLFCKYARYLNTSHGLLMYFDTCQIPLALGAKAPCSFSGIYFRPTFHYSGFTSQRCSRQAQLQAIKEKVVLARVLHHPKLKTLFSLDPFAVQPIDQLKPKANIVHLPDPVQIVTQPQSQVEVIKERLGIEPDRKVFLLFGALDSRKGVHQVLEALQLLQPELCQATCLLLVGQIKSTEREAIELKISYLQTHYPVQIIYHNEYVPEQEVQAYFNLAHGILATYQQHVGMSGILLQAAAAGKPVLSSDYGLMGEMVRHHQLGVAIDSTKPAEIAIGLAQLLLEKSTVLCNPLMMQRFAEQNSAERFAEIIFQNLLEKQQR